MNTCSGIDRDGASDPLSSISDNQHPSSSAFVTDEASTENMVKSSAKREISRQVIRRKLARQRHCLIQRAIAPAYLDSLFPALLELFSPQPVQYNGGIAGVKNWKISCYLEVMPGGVPTTDPCLPLLQLFRPLLDSCDNLFLHWYRQQHACNNKKKRDHVENRCRRLMTFVTRYRPNPGEAALLKHVDGAGKVDGSVVVALPMDRWSPGNHEFEGGGLTFWDGKDENGRTRETHYDTRSGDVAFIDRAVWHQADPITKGTRWALVIFYKVD